MSQMDELHQHRNKPHISTTWHSLQEVVRAGVVTEVEEVDSPPAAEEAPIVVAEAEAEVRT